MDHVPFVISMLATFAKEKNGYPSTGEKKERRKNTRKKEQNRTEQNKSFRSDGQHTVYK